MKLMVACSLVVVATLSLHAHRARAQALPASVPALVAPAPTADRADHEVSPWVAAALSIGGTAASFATIGVGHHSDVALSIGAVGAVVAPSLGRWYSHHASVGGLIVRGIGAGVMTGGLVGLDCTGSPCNTHVPMNVALVGVGGAAYLGGALLDLIGAPLDAHKYNQRLENVALAPMLPSDHHGAGLVLSARF